MNNTVDSIQDIREHDELLTTKQAAALCNVKPDRMRTLAGDGRVPAVMRQHAWWFSARELRDLIEQHPEVIHGRRTPQVVVTVAMRESRRANMLRINAMRTAEERHQAAKRGHAGLLEKLARQIDPELVLDPAERDRRVQMMYRAQLADARSRRAAGRKLTTLEQRVTALQAQTEQAEREALELRARRAAGNHAVAPESLAICFDCWRAAYGGRVPAGLTNKLCAEHQAELDEFAASLRAAS